MVRTIKTTSLVTLVQSYRERSLSLSFFTPSLIFCNHNRMVGFRARYIWMLLLVSCAMIRYVGKTSAADPGFNLRNNNFNETGFSNDSTLPRNGSLENCTHTEFITGVTGNITSNVSACLKNDPTVPSDSPPIVAVYATLFFGSWSVVANSLPLAAIVKHEHLHTPAYILMANLAASDVLTGVDFLFAGSSVLYYIDIKTTPSIATSRVFFTLILLSGLSSAYSLLALTAERFWFIVHGMTYVNNVTNDKCKVVIAVVWVWSVLLAMLPNFGWHCASRIEEGCLSLGGGLPNSYVVLILVFVFIPMAAIVYFNLSIFWCLWKHVNAIAAQEAAVGAPPSVNRKSAVTIVIITIVFLVGWLPFAIKIAMFTADSISILKMVVFIILNSAVNPVIYGFRLHEVRRGVTRLFRSNHGNGNLDLP
ncbi:G-protein coupled receptor 6-like [Branchiostoma lanceolatum]|uniref:G-protein coupled receptor 6-like n=1 Tax=Branchiostoma lanceolatum TaxID=7740 RepID=UPI0034552165